MVNYRPISHTKGFDGGQRPPDSIVHKDFDVIQLNPFIEEDKRIKYYKEFMNTGKIRSLNINKLNSIVEVKNDKPKMKETGMTGLLDPQSQNGSVVR